MNDVLEIKNLYVSYDNQKNAVDNLSLRVRQGEIIGIVGESGSGKSTLIHTIMGLLPHKTTKIRGQIHLLGHHVQKKNEAMLKTIRGQDIAMIFQDAGRYLNPTAKIEKQYRDFLKAHENISSTACKKRAKEMLSKFHLRDIERILNSYPFELSGGMCQRVSIAMAMTYRPKLLLADEPTSALDVTIQAQVIRQMMNLREKYGTSIVIVTHNIGVAAYISDYIGVMKQGQLVEYQKADKLLSQPQHSYTKELLSSTIELGDK